MTYRISYDEVRALQNRPGKPDATRTEYYPTEHEAMHRARELIEAADHEAVAVVDGAGNVLGGFRLQLRLGYTNE